MGEDNMDNFSAILFALEEAASYGTSRVSGRTNQAHLGQTAVQRACKRIPPHRTEALDCCCHPIKTFSLEVFEVIQ